ncbi:MAG: RiPP maturation radical SAM C-methyltransferase [Candidatus Baltobacteraceae bacterium]
MTGNWSAKDKRKIIDVVFVSMPFAMPEHPSLGLSLLKAELAAAHISSRIEYLNLAFLDAIGFELFDGICRSRETDLIGEWIFGESLRNCSDGRDAAFVQRQRDVYGAEFIAGLLQAREHVPQFMEYACARILSGRPKVVGFTSVFQQHAASLSLAQHLKRREPSVRIIFGGANCEAVMGETVARIYDCIDTVVSGEADGIIVALIENHLAGKVAKRFTSGSAVQDLDVLPDPDFTDYFDQVAELAQPLAFESRLLIETARGCWWGAKHHCTFCGLNGTTMAYRSKSPARAVAELERLAQRYNVRSIGVVDNIMDMKYLDTVFPELARRGLDFDILYEVKANLKKSQLRALRAAGVKRLQPGIESLSTPVLSLMRKGVRAIQNVQLLKWCKQLDLGVSWNILWGFPGEMESEYAAMARLVPQITHLEPPLASGQLRLDRFSPNFEDTRAAGLSNVQPYAAYADVYGVSAKDCTGLAYYFTFEYADGRDVEAYTAPLADALADWRERHTNSHLFAVDYGEYLLIADWRTKEATSVVLSGLDRVLYLHCDEICGIANLLETARAFGEPLTAQGLELRFAPLIEAGLAMREGDTFLALAIGLDEYVAETEHVASLRAMAMMLLAA